MKLQYSCVYDHILYLICPGLLRAEDDTSCGIQARFIGSTRSLHYLFMYLFVFEMYNVLLSTSANTNHILTTENSRRFPPVITPLFLLTTLYTTSHVPLVYSTTNVSHPILLSAANGFLV